MVSGPSFALMVPFCPFRRLTTSNPLNFFISLERSDTNVSSIRHPEGSGFVEARSGCSRKLILLQRRFPPDPFARPEANPIPFAENPQCGASSCHHAWNRCPLMVSCTSMLARCSPETPTQPGQPGRSQPPDPRDSQRSANALVPNRAQLVEEERLTPSQHKPTPKPTRSSSTPSMHCLVGLPSLSHKAKGSRPSLTPQ